MTRKHGGFTLVELMITMVVFVLVMAGASQVFVGLLTQFKQQSRLAETNIEGVVGLEILRRDLEHAGYGLPWSLGGAGYQEAVNDSSCAQSTAWVDRNLNDGPPDNPVRGTDAGNTSNPPGAIRSLNNDSSAFNRSDVLAIKSSNVGMSDASQEWTIQGVGDVKNNGRSSSDTYKDQDRIFQNNDYVIILQPGNSDANGHTLATYTSGSTLYWYTTYNATANFAPTDVGQTNVIYGIKPQGSPAVVPRMPFNRADYYIQQPTSGMPLRCAPNTGILYKAVLNHSDGCHSIYPLLDCVADMEVVYRLDTNGDGAIDSTTDDTSSLTAAQLRQQLKEVRVYLLAQEGQVDPNYTHSPTNIYVGDSAIGSGRSFSIGTAVHYRWKLYRLVVHPSNLE
jgi:prepilin-type N-terminal cleavage/methylation domain-containing protein